MTEHDYELALERQAAYCERLEEELDELRGDYASLERYCEKLEQGLEGGC